MTLRSGHGAGAGVPRVEVLPADELPPPNPTAAPAGPVARRPDGRFDGSEAAKAAGRLGGLASAQRTRLLASLGLTTLSADHAFAPYESAGNAFAEKHVATLASQFDGTCGEGPSSIVKTAGIQLAASRFFYDLGKQTGDAKLLGDASKMGDASRQNILAAYEIQSRECAARAKANGPADLTARILAPHMKKGTP